VQPPEQATDSPPRPRLDSVSPVPDSRARLSKPRLLFLAQVLPFPPDGGVAIRTYNILRLLAREYDITALCFYRRATVRDVGASVTALSAFARVMAFPILEERSALKRATNHLRSVLGRRVYTVLAYEHPGFRSRLRRELRDGAFDLVHVDSLDLSGYLGELGAIPTVCVHHNVESALLRRRAGLATNRVVARYLQHQADLMEREESAWCPRLPLNVAVSDDDRAQLERIAPGARVLVVPNGVDTDAFRPAEVPQAGIVFVGGMTWFPNRDALEFFSSEIRPLLARGGVTPRVTWVGRATDGATERYRALGVELTGYVDDIRPHVDAAACYVVPLRVGGGTRLKVLDAWAMGKAVVSTSVGCEGLEARDGWNILIRDDPGDFADAVMRVLDDPELRATLGRNARATVEERYGWTVIGSRFLPEYEAVRRAGRAITGQGGDAAAVR
jgi:glycosyltransferase involved in cell wall biosynthesis